MNKKIHILAVTDYSLVAANACRYAFQFAKHINASITFLHIYQYPAFLPDSITERDRIKNYLADIESKKIEQFRLEILDYFEVDPHESASGCFAYEGDVTEEILEEAKRSDAKFIVAGTHGAFGFRKYMMGSHAWEIIRKSEIPVLVVPLESAFRGFKNIIFGTEYNSGEIPVINFVSRLAKLSDGNVTILHISGNTSTADAEMHAAKAFQQEIIDKTGFSNFNFNIIHNEEVVEGLDKFCVEKNADCLILSNNRSFSIDKILPPLFKKNKKISVNTHVPLLVIPAYYSVLQKKYWESAGLEYHLR